MADPNGSNPPPKSPKRAASSSSTMDPVSPTKRLRPGTARTTTATTTTTTTTTTASSSSSIASPPFTADTTINTSTSPNAPNNFVQIRSSLLTVTSVLHLSEEAVWSLRKADLRNCFLALQSYSLSHLPPAIATRFPSVLPTLSSSSTAPRLPHTPALLRLPLEIRQQIYLHCLSPAVSPPMRGPHPRQLQNPLSLTQPIPPALLRINQQIRTEALPLLYGAPTQTVHVVIDYNIWAHKTKRSDLVLSSIIPSSLRQVHVTLCLGSEKRSLTSNTGANTSTTPTSPLSSSVPATSTSGPNIEASTRLLEVRKGVKKLGKWISGADIRDLVISWQEPPNTYSWDQKMEVLDGLKVLRAVRVRKGEINWGLESRGKWNKGRRYRFVEGWEKSLERGREEC